MGRVVVVIAEEEDNAGRMEETVGANRVASVVVGSSRADMCM